MNGMHSFPDPSSDLVFLPFPAVLCPASGVPVSHIMSESLTREEAREICEHQQDEVQNPRKSPTGGEHRRKHVPETVTSV